MASQLPLILNTVNNDIEQLPSTDVLAAACFPSAVDWQNLAHNGDFRVWQRGTSLTCADTYYGPDRHYLLTQTGNVTVSQVSPSNISDGCKILQPNATAQRFGITHVLESTVTKRLRSGTCFLKCKANLNGQSMNLHTASLGWTGTADSITRDVVNNWTSSTYTPGNFFASTSLELDASGAIAATSGVDADITLAISVGASVNNLIFFIWTEGTVNQNNYLTISEYQIVPSTITPSAFYPRDPSVEWNNCRRFAQGFNGDYIGRAQSTTQTYQAFPMSPRMRTAPSIESGALAASYTATAGNAGTPSSVVTPTAASFWFGNSGLGWTTNAGIAFTGILSADL